MQLDKSKNKIAQIEIVSNNSEEITENILSAIKKFNLNSYFSTHSAVKRCGKAGVNILLTLLLLPFWGETSVSSLFTRGLNKLEDGQKDAYYDLKNNEKIKWRSLLIVVAKRFMFLMNQSDENLLVINEGIEKIKAIVFDDTKIEKTGVHIEGVGYVHSHTSNTYLLGYKLLVCGFWEGKSFNPIDFSFHKETRDKDIKKTAEKLKKEKERVHKKELEIKEAKESKTLIKKELKAIQKDSSKKSKASNKKIIEKKQRILSRKDVKINDLKIELKALKIKARETEDKYIELKSTYRHCGLTAKVLKEQFKKTRDRKSAGYKRIKEMEMSKIDVAITMLKRAVKQGFVPDYVITDTWFFCQKFLLAVINTGRSINLLSMAKIGTTNYMVLQDNKLLNAHQIIANYERTKSKTCRKYKARYFSIMAEYQDVKVKLFFVRFNSHQTWRLLVTTDLKISFTKIMDVYKIRWTIEVFFKECKQYLLLGKCQSRDFDAQIADTTLSLIRYILLSFYKRIHYGTTIGGIFQKLKQEATKENLLTDIRVCFIKLLSIFANIGGIDIFDFFQNLLKNPENELLLQKIIGDGNKIVVR